MKKVQHDVLAEVQKVQERCRECRRGAGWCWGGAGAVAELSCHLHGDESVIHGYLLSKEVRADGGLVPARGGGAHGPRTLPLPRVAVLWQGAALVSSGGAAAHWLLNFLLTYWFMSEVLPTPESPRMITFSSTFLRLAMAVSVSAHHTLTH